MAEPVAAEPDVPVEAVAAPVEAAVEVSVAQIYGTVNGDITATKRIELGRVAKVTGNIQTPALVIEQGAIFEGSCRMAQQRDAQAKDEARAAAASPGNGKTDAAKPTAADSTSLTTPSSASTSSSSPASTTPSSSSSPSSASGAAGGAQKPSNVIT